MTARETRQGLFPLSVLEDGVLFRGTVVDAPIECIDCVDYSCRIGGAVGIVNICQYSVNIYRLDSRRVVCGFYLQSYKPTYPTPKLAQREYKKRRRQNWRASEGGKSSSFIKEATWRNFIDQAHKWSLEQTAATSQQQTAEMRSALSRADKADQIRAYIREATPGLESAVRHDLSQLATAINSALENILDMKYGSVSTALGWSRPPVIQHDEVAVWRREKAAFFFSDLLNLRAVAGTRKRSPGKRS